MSPQGLKSGLTCTTLTREISVWVILKAKHHHLFPSHLVLHLNLMSHDEAQRIKMKLGLYINSNGTKNCCSVQMVPLYLFVLVVLYDIVYKEWICQHFGFSCVNGPVYRILEYLIGNLKIKLH